MLCGGIVLVGFSSLSVCKLSIALVIMYIHTVDCNVNCVHKLILLFNIALHVGP